MNLSQTLFSQSPLSAGQTSNSVTLPTANPGDGTGNLSFVLTAFRDTGAVLTDGTFDINRAATLRVVQSGSTVATLKPQDFINGMGAIGFSPAPSGAVTVVNDGPGNVSSVQIARSLDR